MYINSVQNNHIKLLIEEKKKINEAFNKNPIRNKNFD